MASWGEIGVRPSDVRCSYPAKLECGCERLIRPDARFAARSYGQGFAWCPEHRITAIHRVYS